MVKDSQRLKDINEIRQYIRQTLCEKDQLETNSFPLTESVIVRGGKPCGMCFCLYGPRSVRLTAVWDTAGGKILFYGSGGKRFRCTRLTGPPPATAPERKEFSLDHRDGG